MFDLNDPGNDLNFKLYKELTSRLVPVFADARASACPKVTFTAIYPKCLNVTHLVI